MALSDGISTEVGSAKSKAMLQKISERIKGRYLGGRLCVVPTHFPYNIYTFNVTPSQVTSPFSTSVIFVSVSTLAVHLSSIQQPTSHLNKKKEQNKKMYVFFVKNACLERYSYVPFSSFLYYYSVEYTN